MLQHLFALMWNKKKQHALLVIEIFFSFMVIFALATMGVYFYKNYRQPLGLADKNVWNVSFTNGGNVASADSLAQFYHNLQLTVASMPGVEDACYSSFNIPFINAMSSTGMLIGNTSHQGIYYFQADDHYNNVLGMTLLEGRWFGKEDDAAAHPPVIINEALRKTAFGNGPALGQLTGSDKDQNRMRVIGVLADAKWAGDYMPPHISMWTRIDTAFYHGVNIMLVRVSPDADANLEANLYKTLSNAMKNANVSIGHLDDTRDSIDVQYLMPAIIFMIIAAFLVINVAFGLFGVLWYNINKRKSEIGLRRAVGASGWSVSRQLWVETLILATFGVVIGLFFAIQFPLLHVFDMSTGVYIAALIFTILFMYVLVTICSLYPGRQAASIFPAEALHED
ncbi:ABC transporter permease [Dinghuibacter silviterrae]|uniref:Putative ABC transport system permease protein n=1 Tax=Dinghuibacter silviterrae TaxID=1539049 RepID=A0A4V6Q9Z4_9BACT|nr:FtsX-like permease family protein [Dinghuibacter silviterrae]TDX00553.1 putative ABC transport system permease protein [Dinghuibacter silviterrae]